MSTGTALSIPTRKQPVNAIASRDLTLQRRTGNSGLYELRAVGTVPDILDSIEEFHAGMTGTSVGMGVTETTANNSTQTPKKRKISAAGRQRIAEAVRARHAAKKQQQGAEGKTEPVAKRKPKTMAAGAG